MEYADEEAARQKVLLDLVNGTGKYDLVMLGSDGAVQTYSYSGYLEPLDGYLDKAKDYFDASKVYPQFLDANRVAGKLWALPYYSFGAGVIYRKDIFDKYGITAFPKTTEEHGEGAADHQGRSRQGRHHRHLRAHHARRARRGAERSTSPASSTPMPATRPGSRAAP